MSDIQPGIYKLGDVSMVTLTPEVLLVSAPKYASEADLRSYLDQLSARLPGKQFIIARGEASYSTFAQCVELREFIRRMIAEVVKA